MINLYTPPTKFPSWPWLSIINSCDLYWLSDCPLFAKDEQNPCPTANPRSNCNHWTETWAEFPIITHKSRKVRTHSRPCPNNKEYSAPPQISPTAPLVINRYKIKKKTKSTRAHHSQLCFSWNRFPVISSAFYLEGTVSFQFCWCTVWYFLEAFVFEIASPAVKAVLWRMIQHNKYTLKVIITSFQKVTVHYQGFSICSI